MRFVFGLLVGALAFVPVALVSVALIADPEAQEDRVDLATRTCGQMLAPENQSKVAPTLIWLAGYHAAPEQGATVDIRALKADIVRTLEYCRSHGDASLLAATEQFMGRNGTAPTADAVDLAGLACGRVLSAETAEEKSRAGQFLFWIAGHDARHTNETVLDEAVMFERFYEAGLECEDAPDSNLMSRAAKHLQQNAT